MKILKVPKSAYITTFGGVFCNWKYSMSQDLPKIHFLGGEGAGGYSVTENTQSPKICLNFNFGSGVFWHWTYLKSRDLSKFQFWAGVYCSWKYSKSQHLSKFQFSGGAVFCNWKYSKSQDLPKFQLSGRYSVIENTQSPNICRSFTFWGGGGRGLFM